MESGYTKGGRVFRRHSRRENSQGYARVSASPISIGGRNSQFNGAYPPAAAATRLDGFPDHLSHFNQGSQITGRQVEPLRGRNRLPPRGGPLDFPDTPPRA